MLINLLLEVKLYIGTERDEKTPRTEVAGLSAQRSSGAELRSSRSVFVVR
jgi:hypothetical protein